MGAYTIPIYDTNGTLRDIPPEQAHDAVAAGGKPGVRFQDPSGKTRYVPADQTQDAINAGGKLLPFEHQDEGVKKWYGFTPSNVAQNVWQGAKGIVGGTYDVAKDLVNNPNWVQGQDSTFHKFIQAPSDDQVRKAGEALEKGNRVEAAGHILASALPLVGPWAAGLGEQAGTGDVGGALGQAAGTVAGGAAMSAAAKGAKAAVPKAAGLIKAGTGELVSAAGATIAPTPTEALTRAIKPTASNTGWDEANKRALPQLKAAEATIGRPVQNIDDALDAMSAAKKAKWAEYQQKLGPNADVTVDGNEIADAMEASVSARKARLNPKLVERVKEEAATYRRPYALGELEDSLQDANNDLHSYYAKNKVGQRVAAGDPETASTVAEVGQIRKMLNAKLDELSPNDPSTAELKKDYGALSNVEEELLRRKNVAARQQPMSLAEQLSTAKGLGKAALGGLTTAGGIALGEPHMIGGGLALAGGGIVEAGVGRWLKARQTTDALIKNAFENYGKPPSATRTLISGTRGEAGLPGTVEEEAPAERRRYTRPAMTGEPNEPERPLPAPEPTSAARRTPEQTRADIRLAAAATPEISALEAQQRGRIAETEQRYPAIPTEQPIQGPTPPPAPGQKPVSYYKTPIVNEPPNAPPFYSKAEKAVATLPGSGTGQQMLATLKNQGVKPGELADMGIEDFLKSRAKFTRAEVADFVAKNKLQLGQKDLINTPGRNVRGEMTFNPAEGDATKYQSYTLPGDKQNYTERLITLPNQGKETSAVTGQSIDVPQRQFQSSHWDEPNVLAHARFDERTTADGKKALFLEEAQSDWHQKGKKEGYVPQQTSPAGWATSQSPTSTGKGVPDAPFKTDWHELVVKNMLREAAERGADKLAWTTGDQQAERYDLSKQIDSLYWQKNADGSFGVSPVKNGAGVPGASLQKASPQEIENLLGKDIATKIQTGSGKHWSGGGVTQGTLSGLDLKIGGDWAKALYDRAIPNFLNKYTKKWGAKVSESTLPGNDLLQEKPQKVHSIDITPAMKKAILKEGQPIASARTFGDGEQAS